MKKNSINIRKFKPQDAQRVKELIASILEKEFSLHQSTFPYNDLADVAATYGGRRDIFLVAEDKTNGVVGTIAIKEDDNNTALLRRIFVDAGYRGFGIGKDLLIRAIEFCEEQNYRIINFCSTDKMTAAISLCQKNGFRRRAAMPLDNVTLLRFSRRLRGARRSKEKEAACAC
ncbi:MAG: GNAT family N-acetyltransferase [Candidatus Omnitrophica bacterium]|nr:GNAT family N-acetyltransferase [Candidatus Omnitrophota bacterium]